MTIESLSFEESGYSPTIRYSSEASLFYMASNAAGATNVALSVTELERALTMIRDWAQADSTPATRVARWTSIQTWAVAVLTTLARTSPYYEPVFILRTDAASHLA